MTTATKVCPRCQRELALLSTNFRKLRKSAYCRTCEKLYARDYAKANPEKIKAIRDKYMAKRKVDSIEATIHHEQALKEMRKQFAQENGLIDPKTGDYYPPDQAKDMV